VGDKPAVETCQQFVQFIILHTVVIGEGKHFKFCVLIDTEEYKCMRDILLPKGMCSESRDIFKVWEISDNISGFRPTVTQYALGLYDSLFQMTF